MHRLSRAPVIAAVLVPVYLGLAACSVEVDKDDQGDKAHVEVTTPVGDVSVHALETPDTGLAVYPGARAVRNEDGNEAADVNVHVPFVHVHVVGAKYESDDAPDQVLAFYRGEMRKFGEVVECTGDIDFKHDLMTCRHRLGRRETTLGVGSEGRHRVVAVKPAGSGTRLSIAYIDTGRQ
jgi:hypothetical protein